MYAAGRVFGIGVQSVQKIAGWMFVLLMMFVLFPSEMAAVYAEEYDSVKDCLENPDACAKSGQNPAENSGGTEDTQKAGTGSLLWDFAKMILATIAVVALIYFLFHYLGKKSREYQQTALLQNIGGIKVGANRSVQIIKVGGRVFVIGVGENVNLLKELSGEEAEELLTKYDQYLDKLAKPQDIISRLRRRFGGKGQEYDEIPFSSVLDEQFREMGKERKEAYEELTKKGQSYDE